MVSLKIKFNGKHFMMSIPIGSLDDVAEQIKERFPNSCPHGLQFFHNGKIINKLEDVLDNSQKN